MMVAEPKVSFWASLKRTARYWRKVVARAWKDTWAASPINSLFKVALWLTTPAAWAIVGTTTHQLPPDVFWVGLEIYAAIFLLVVVLKLLSLPPTFETEDKAKHDAKWVALAAERDTATAKLSAKAARDDRYDYALSVHVDVSSDIFGQNPIPMNWHLKLANRSNVPIEYQHIEFDRRFGDGPGSSSYGQGRVLRPSESTVFSFNVDPIHWLPDGVLHVSVAARFGQPNGRPSRRLTKAMRVQYRYMNALTDSTCHTISESEEDIPDGATN